MKIGIPWYREREYDELREMFDDGANLPDTYSQWRFLADQTFERIRSEGHIVVKAYIVLGTFPEWCRVKNLRMDSAARTAFANQYAFNDDSV